MEELIKRIENLEQQNKYMRESIDLIINSIDNQISINDTFNARISFIHTNVTSLLEILSGVNK